MLGLTFSSGNYGTKGCYSYKGLPTTHSYYGKVYFGTGEGDRKSELEAPKYRPVGSEKFCEAAAAKLNLKLTKKSSYSTKGCYGYNDGRYDGEIFFGTEGTHEQNQKKISGSANYRPEPCVPKTEKACQVAGNQMNKEFSASTYSTKGCYAYNYDAYKKAYNSDYTGTRYAGMHYGKGGNPMTTVSLPKERPVIYTDGTITAKDDCI